MRRSPAVPALAAALLLAAAPAVQAAEVGSIAGTDVNLRAGPGKDHKRLFQVSRGYPVKVLERRDGWVRVEDFQGDRAWVFGELLSDKRTVLVIKDLVNIRKGPSTEQAIAFKARRNVLLDYLGGEGDWVHVRHADGDEGWVYAPLVWGD